MLQQKLSQKMLQKLSPQQIQLMKLFQIPTALFEQRIKEELESNPALDEGTEQENEEIQEANESTEEDEIYDEPTLDENYLEEYAEDDPISYNQNINRSSDDEHREYVAPVRGTFHDALLRQFELLSIDNETDDAIGRQIIGSIDEDGYLRRDVESIIDDLLFTQNIIVSEAEIEQMLHRIQQFDPAGVGSRNLQENLLLQLKRKIALGEVDDDRLLALKIVKDYFKQFSKKHFEKLVDSLQITDDHLRRVIDIILSLNPKPASGSDFQTSDSANHYVIPDFIVENKEGELSLSLNGKNAPDIHVSRRYSNILDDYRTRIRNRKPTKEEKNTINFIKQKIDTAKWFIDAIRQRQHTLYNTMYAIMQLQRDYFLSGDPLKLKPMILKDVSDLTNLDISTVSRVVNNKYVQTEFGTKRLKEFFSEALVMPDGKEVSSLEVKNALLDIINNENKSEPFSDEQLKLRLSEQGYQIARRTVTKYREHLNKPVARLRREL